MTPGPSASLPRSLGLARLSLYGIGTITGAGIYSVVAPAAGLAGEAVWMSFVVAAAISAFSGLSYAEIASAMPGAGAEHHFLRKTFPRAPALAFVVGLFIAVHGASTLAAVALTFGSHARTVVPLTPWILAVGLLCVATAVNVAGVGKAAIVSAVLTVLQIACLVAFASTAIPSGGRGLPEISTGENGISGVLGGAAVLFFIYSGYEHMASLSEEAKRPDKDLWRAFMIALAVTTVVYVAVILGILGVEEAPRIASSESPLIDAASRLGGPFGPLILVAALGATANAVLSGSMSGSRLLFGMARDGDLPRWLSKTVGERRSPWTSALVVLALACALVSVGEITFVASLSSLGVTLVFTSVNIAVIVLRFTQPDLERPFRLPSIGSVPPTAVLGVVASLALALQYGWRVYLTFAGVVTVGALPYVLIRRRNPSGESREA